MKKLSLTLIAISCLGLTAHANLIVNGSFEMLPKVLSNGSWTTYTSIDGWTASIGDIEVRNNVDGVAQDGNIFVELDAYSNSTMKSQAIATEVGQAYTLSYYYAPRHGVSYESNGIQLCFNGNLIDSYTSYSTSNNDWTQRVFTVTGTGSDVISFSAAGISDSYGGSIDNVVMEASVPEPSTLLLFCFGLIGIIGFRKKNLTK